MVSKMNCYQVPSLFNIYHSTQKAKYTRSLGVAVDARVWLCFSSPAGWRYILKHENGWKTELTNRFAVMNLAKMWRFAEKKELQTRGNNKEVWLFDCYKIFKAGGLTLPASIHHFLHKSHFFFAFPEVKSDSYETSLFLNVKFGLTDSLVDSFFTRYSVNL